MEQEVPAQIHGHGPGAAIALKLWVWPEPLDPWPVGLLEPGFIHACRVVHQYYSAGNKKDGLPQPSHARNAATPVTAI